MKKTALYLLVGAMFLLTGCPVLTRNSIDNGSYDVPSWLPGTWHVIRDDGTAGTCYVLKKEPTRGNLMCYEADSSGKIKGEDARRLILSDVGGKTYLCVYDPSDDTDQQGYYIYEFRKVSKNEVVLAGIRENAIGFDDSAADIIGFLVRNKDSQDIYDEKETVHYKKL